MPMADDAEFEPIKPNKIKVTPDGFKSVLHDSGSTSASDLITHIEGAKWEVTFYIEVTTTDAGTSGKSLNIPAAYQSYKRIDRMELRVQDPLSTSMDTKINSATVTGSSLVYPGVVPNIGNLFVAKMGDGRYGVFQVTNVEAKTIYLNSAYLINYMLLKFLTEEDKKDFARKTVEEYVFVRAFMQYSRDPLVSKKDFERYGNLQNALSEIKRYYCDKFFASGRSTFLIPDQQPIVIDTYLVRFLLRILESGDHPVVSRCRSWTIGDAIDRDRSIWDAILDRNKTYLYTCFSRATPQSVSVLSGNNYSFTLRYSGISQFMMPIDREEYADNSRLLPISSSPGLVNKISDTKNLMGMLGDRLIDDSPFGQLPLITPFESLKGSYVVSEEFYTDMSATSSFEAMLSDYINNRPVDPDVLTTLVATYHGWGLLERFYYLPILMAVLKTEMVGISY